jgi:hypothetical protein
VTEVLIDDCYLRAIALMREASLAEGFAASPRLEHYVAIWGRDAAISCLGAYASGEHDLIATARRTLMTLAERSSELGQIPNAVWPARGYWDWGEAASIDATAWFVVAAARHLEATGDQRFLEQIRPALGAAWSWLRHQQANNAGLVDQPPAADWMDSSLSRSGKALYTNVLVALAAVRLTELGLDVGPLGGEEIAERVNLLFWPEPDRDLGELLAHVPYPDDADTSFPHPATAAAYTKAASIDRRYYVSHVSFGQVVDRCDVLGNLLAVVTGLAPSDRADRILDYLDDVGAAQPFPTKALPEPVLPGNDPQGMFVEVADRNQAERWRNPPGAYHNGAVWPFIGGFHVLALAERGRREAAESMLARLAAANDSHGDAWGFPEWLHAETGRPAGATGQTWNAAAYVLAYRALEDR